MVDAPVSGGVDGAEAGTLSIMVGGEERDVADAWAVLSACGNPVHLGPLGSGQVAKACNQMIVASTILALGEAAVSPTGAGSTWPRCSACSAVDTPGAASWRAAATGSSGGLQSVGRSEVHGQGPRLRSAVAAATGTHAVLLPAMKAAFEELTAQGHGDNDIAVTRRYVEQR